MSESQAISNAVACIEQAAVYGAKGLKKSQQMILDVADSWMKLAISIAQMHEYRRQ